MPGKEEKQLIINELKGKLKKSRVIILANYRGLDVATITRLRRSLKECDSELKVAKNTLTRIAVKETGLQDLIPYLEGPTAIVFGFNDHIAPAKVLMDFTQEFKQLEIKGGLLEGRAIQSIDVKYLASLPSREVLISKVIGNMQAPLCGLVNALQGNIRNIVYVLETVRKQKAGEAAS